MQDADIHNLLLSLVNVMLSRVFLVRREPFVVTGVRGDNDQICVALMHRTETIHFSEVFQSIPCHPRHSKIEEHTYHLIILSCLKSVASQKPTSHPPADAHLLLPSQRLLLLRPVIKTQEKTPERTKKNDFRISAFPYDMVSAGKFTTKIMEPYHDLLTRTAGLLNFDMTESCTV
jgi:hypothetical protein